MKIIVGLGNPGEKYKLTRHNAGFMALDAIVAQRDLSWQTNKKLNALIAKEADTIYAKPLAYMNNSGQILRAVLAYYKLLPKKFGFLKLKNSDLTKILTVIHDDIDIELGKYKIAAGSRSAGHKGVESIIQYLKTKNFQRIRIGISNHQRSLIPAEKFVLQKFNEAELKIINNQIAEIIPAL